MRRALLVVFLTAGCGRFGFSERMADDEPDASPPGDTLAPDAPPAPCYKAFDGPVYDDSLATGADLMGVKLVIPNALSITRLEVFTGEQTGTSALSLRAHDGVANAPATVLGTSTFDMALAVGWQGADLPAPVPIAPNTTVWLVWDMVGGAQSSIEVYASGMSTNPAAQTYRGSADGGQTWNGPFKTEIKLRLWCDGQR